MNTPQSAVILGVFVILAASILAGYVLTVGGSEAHHRKSARQHARRCRYEGPMPEVTDRQLRRRIRATASRARANKRQGFGRLAELDRDDLSRLIAEASRRGLDLPR
ncbi:MULTISPECIES: hypothetical protein [Bacteria]|uniref:hypothetical protein n=1 Tax=Bacteria TaxID=2 RepID=UPI003C7A7069